MRQAALKRIGLGLGTLGVIGTAWLLLVPGRSEAIRLRTGLPTCAGETGRFQITAYGQRQIYLLDSCSGEVWALVQSPDKLEPGAWVIMDHYDTREEAIRLLDYLRGAGEPTQPVDTPVRPGQQPYPNPDDQPHAVNPQYHDAEPQYAEPDTFQPHDQQQHPDTRQRYRRSR